MLGARVLPRLYVLARAGKRTQAKALLDALEVTARRDYVSPVAFATLHIGLERWDRALDWAERAYEERRGWLAYLKVNPILDPLREQPRFTVLIRTLRL
jgi:eukaryotic-like serine/threonine-protein kinase